MGEITQAQFEMLLVDGVKLKAEYSKVPGFPGLLKVDSREFLMSVTDVKNSIKNAAAAAAALGITISISGEAQLIIWLIAPSWGALFGKKIYKIEFSGYQR